MADTPQYPIVRLAGKDFAIKPLTIRQFRVVVPAMLRLGKVNPNNLTEANMDDMFEVIYQAICPALEKPLPRNEFMDMQCTTQELLAAVPVVAAQSGTLQNGGPEGEARAGKPSTGTESSPTSANVPAGPGITSKTP